VKLHEIANDFWDRFDNPEDYSPVERREITESLAATIRIRAHVQAIRAHIRLWEPAPCPPANPRPRGISKQHGVYVVTF
jgi:hypothetical protein